MKYEIICTINNESTIIKTIKKVRKFIKKDLEYWNEYEKKEPYNEDDYIINKMYKSKKRK